MQATPRRCFLTALSALSALFSAVVCSVAVADEDDAAQRIPTDVRGLYSPVEKSLEPQAALPGGPRQYPRDTPKGEAELDEPRPPVLTNAKARLQHRDAFFRDMTVDFYTRSQYFNQDNAIGHPSQAWAGGGALSIRTGYFDNWFKLEGAVATSQPLYAPQGEGGTLLLTANQGEVSSVYIGNAHARVLGQELVAGRQLIKTPYINPYDTRMIPNSVEGLVITRTLDEHHWLNYSLGYFWNFKARDSSYFVPFSEELGVEEDRGVLLTGTKIEIVEGVTLGGFNYYIADVLNTTFAEVDWVLPRFAHGVDFRVGANYTSQRTVGAELMRNGPFTTDQVSARLAASYANATAYLAVSSNSKNAKLVSPFSSFPAYTNMDQMHFEDAGTTAFVGGVSYDFSEVITDGLKLAVLYGNAYDVVDALTELPLSDQREVDVKLEYLPKSGPLTDLRLLFIYSHVEFPDNRPGERSQPQFHGYITYLLPAL